jgi:hypothetical protein
MTPRFSIRVTAAKEVIKILDVMFTKEAGRWVDRIVAVGCFGSW